MSSFLSRIPERFRPAVDELEKGTGKGRRKEERSYELNWEWKG